MRHADRTLATLVSSIVTLLLTCAAAPAQECEPGWSEEFAPTDVTAPVRAMVVFDDGSGPALYVGGQFLLAGELQVLHVARWDGERWEALGQGLMRGNLDIVYALAVFDDGSGPSLYVGGNFVRAGGQSVRGIARWDGQQWHDVGGGIQGQFVRSLEVFDDGTGPALYASGRFTTMGGVPVNNIAKWDGQQWSDVGGGLTGEVTPAGFAMEVFDDGSGPALYVGGEFSEAGGVPAANIARWDGASWSAVGAGFEEARFVLALAALDDGTGPALYAGGAFAVGSGNNVARWDGSAWSPVGEGIGAVSGDLIATIELHDDGTGPRIYAGGNAPGGLVFRWNGQAWEPLGDGNGINGFHGVVRVLKSFDDGAGPTLFAGGDFFSLGTGYGWGFFARWDGEAWTVGARPGALSGPLGGREITHMQVLDDGDGEALYITGGFTALAGVASRNIIRRRNGRWEPVDPRPGPSDKLNVSDLAFFDDGDGPALYAAGGSRWFASGLHSVSRLRDGVWEPVVRGRWPASAIEAFDDGTTARLFATGYFIDYNGGKEIATIEITPGGPVPPPFQVDGGHIRSMLSYDAPEGPVMFIGGSFTSSAGDELLRIARWDGKTLAPLGGGIGSATSEGTVLALAVAETPGGPHLFAAGAFQTAEGRPARNIARWDGQMWHDVGGGTDGPIFRAFVYDDGSGPSLYVWGDVTEAGGVKAEDFARWDGREWSAVAAPDEPVAAFAGYDEPTGPSLWFGGRFRNAGGVPSGSIARWILCPPDDTCPADFDRDGALTSADFFAFLSAYFDGDAAADFDGDGLTTTDDFFLFLEAFLGGC